MTSLRSYILESKFIPSAMAKALFSVLPLVEATNINKDFLLKTAGSPEALATAKQSVNDAWATDEMDGMVRNQKIRQKVLNMLYLLEIRKPGFTNHDTLKGIHDLAMMNSLEQRFLSKVNSDTTPDEAAELLAVANRNAVQAAKTYPDLTDDEEAIWNRVKVYHEFPDGFRWVYAVDASGKIASYMPSTVSGKTMHHCGNSPRAGSTDQYWELRDARGKAYLTVILNDNGQVEESKSFGNQRSTYRKQILPYVKWFLMDRKVTGVGPRYDHGYATHMNFGVKDFIGEDPEFVDYVIANKASLVGNAESRILFWRNALDEGLVTVDGLKKAYESGITRSKFLGSIPGMEQYAETAKFKITDGQYDRPDSMFGANGFAVLCAACDGCPFSEDELKGLISSGKLLLEEFANYDIKLLTPELQKEFVRVPGRHNLETMFKIAEQVATFKVDDETVLGLVTGSSNQWTEFLQYLVSANPPSKVKNLVSVLETDGDMMHRLEQYAENEDGDALRLMVILLGRFSELKVEPWMSRMLPSQIRGRTGYMGWSRGSQCNIVAYMDYLLELDDSRLHELMCNVDAETITGISKNLGTDFSAITKFIELAGRSGLLDTINRMIETGSCAPVFSIGYFLTTGEGGDICKRIVLEQFRRCEERQVSNQYDVWSYRADCGLSIGPNAIFSAVLKMPEIIDEVDWEHSSALSVVLGVLLSYSGELPASITSSDVDNALERIVAKGIDLFDGETSPALCMDWISYSTSCSIVDGIVRLGERYGISAIKYRDALTLIAERWFAINSSKHNLQPELNGAGEWILFPMDKWEELSRRFGFIFIAGYIIDGTIAGGVPSDTAWPALLDILDGMDDRTKGRIIEYISACARHSHVPALIQELTLRLTDGRMHLNSEQLGRLMQNHLVPAKIIRKLISNGTVMQSSEPVTLKMIAGISNSLSKLTKVPTLPEMVHSAMKVSVDELYQNLGTVQTPDGYEWKCNEQVGDMMITAMAGLLSRMVSYLNRYYVAKAYLSMADDADIVGRLEAFAAENRKAAGNNKPRFACWVETDISSVLSCLQNSNRRETAEAAVRAAEEKKAPRTRKKKAVTA